MSEAHQLAFAALDLLDEARNVLVPADLVQHVEHFFVGAAVQGAGERGNRRGRAGERIGARAAHGAHGAGAAILLVVGVQDEQHFQGARQHRVGHVLRLRPPPQHVHVVLGVAEVGIGIDEGQPQPVAVGERRQGGHLADQPDHLLAPDLGVGDVARVGVEGGKRCHRAHQDAHGMGVVVEAVDELLHVLVQHGVPQNFAVPESQFVGGGQIPVQQQVGDFQEGAVLGELFDGIPAIEKDTGLAIQEGDGALAGSRIHVGRVIGHQPEIAGAGFDLAEVHGADGPAVNRDGVVFLGPIVGYGERLVVHACVLQR